MIFAALLASIGVDFSNKQAAKAARSYHIDAQTAVYVPTLDDAANYKRFGAATGTHSFIVQKVLAELENVQNLWPIFGPAVRCLNTKKNKGKPINIVFYDTWGTYGNARISCCVV